MEQLDERLKGQYASLSPQEQRVADFIFDHFDDLISYNSAELAQLSGIYVPRFYEPQYDAGGMFCGMQVSTQVPASVKRQWVRELDNYPQTSAIMTDATEFENMYIVEVARGCGRHCRWTRAGCCAGIGGVRCAGRYLSAGEHRVPHP
mgnify:CR=1 FL=1